MQLFVLFVCSSRQMCSKLSFLFLGLLCLRWRDWLLSRPVISCCCAASTCKWGSFPLFVLSFKHKCCSACPEQTSGQMELTWKVEMLVVNTLFTLLDARGASFQCSGQNHVWLWTQGTFQTKLWRFALQILSAGAPHAGGCSDWQTEWVRACNSKLPVYLTCDELTFSACAFFFQLFPIISNYFPIIFRNTFLICITTFWTSASKRTCTRPNGSSLSSLQNSLSTWSSTLLTYSYVRWVLWLETRAAGNLGRFPLSWFTSLFRSVLVERGMW